MSASDSKADAPEAGGGQKSGANSRRPVALLHT